MTAYSAIDSAVESIRQGAYHYLTKPFKQDELALFLERAFADLRVRREAAALDRRCARGSRPPSIIGHSPAMQALRDRILRVADARRSGARARRDRRGQGSGRARAPRRQRARERPVRRR